MANVMDYLQGRGVVFTVIPHREEPAGAGEHGDARVPGDLVARTVVVIANYGAALMVVPAARQLDMGLVAQAVGDARAREATPSEVERQFPDYQPGALPPMSMMLLVPTYVDPAVMEHDEIVFAAGRSNISIRMGTRDLFGSDPIVVAPLTAQSAISPATA